ncbi:hypothetical protein PVIIG_03420 [Plasmodium vivax India VII]|uniref:Uncharacterized protein n=1 Tax=Plasmodium vivax India VII TaxID=1077284 RepID=A0A0J9SHV2_PLAVI|nr:hypothetical protein PVIIG_03420 [Plasmodium vivax India VII]
MRKLWNPCCSRTRGFVWRRPARRSSSLTVGVGLSSRVSACAPSQRCMPAGGFSSASCVGAVRRKGPRLPPL